MQNSRLSPMSVEGLSSAQRAVYDEVNKPPRTAHGFAGPYAAYIKAPNVGGPTLALGTAVRFGVDCPEKYQKIASCLVGQHYQAKFEFAAQIPYARQAGLSDAQIESLRLGQEPTLDGDDDRAVFAFCRQLVQERRVDDDTYAKARNFLGETQLAELVATIAYYTTVCITLNAFDVGLPDGMDDPFPEDAPG